MLSFLQDTCDQIGQEALNEACDWAVANPALALALSIGSAALAVGGLFWSRSRHAAPSSEPAVARMIQPRTREAFLSAVQSTPIATSELPQLEKAAAAPEKMPVQMIVNAYMEQQRQAHGNIGQTRLLAILFPVAPGQISRTLSPADINAATLTRLGLSANGHIPADREGRLHYNQVLQDLKLDHLKLQDSQLKLRY